MEKPTVFSKPKEYDQATQLLWDLHAIARREDDIAAFTARVRELLAGNDIPGAVLAAQRRARSHVRILECLGYIVIIEAPDPDTGEYQPVAAAS